MKTNQTNNKTIAQALSVAAQSIGETVASVQKALARKAAVNGGAVVKRVKKSAAAPSAMASVVETASKGTKKAENYTAENTEDLLAGYADGVSVEDLAAMFGKTARSIVAKLSREGVYQKKEYVTKTGEKPVSKELHVAAIAAFMGVSADKLESLEKANKGVLQLIEAAFKKSAQDYANETEAAQNAA